MWTSCRAQKPGVLLLLYCTAAVTGTIIHQQTEALRCMRNVCDEILKYASNTRTIVRTTPAPSLDDNTDTAVILDASYEYCCAEFLAELSNYLGWHHANIAYNTRTSIRTYFKYKNYRCEERSTWCFKRVRSIYVRRCSKMSSPDDTAVTAVPGISSVGYYILCVVHSSK